MKWILCWSNPPAFPDEISKICEKIIEIMEYKSVHYCVKLMPKNILSHFLVFDNVAWHRFEVTKYACSVILVTHVVDHYNNLLLFLCFYVGSKSHRSGEMANFASRVSPHSHATCMPLALACPFLFG